MRWNRVLALTTAAALSVLTMRWIAQQVVMRTSLAAGTTAGCECLWSLGDLAVWVEQDNDTAVCSGGVQLYQRLPGDPGGYPLCRLSDPPAWLERRLRQRSVRTWLRLAAEPSKPRRVPVWGHVGGDFITEQLAKEHTWEEQLVAPLLKRLLKLGAGNVTLIDVGCNIGAYTLQAAALGFPVIAVDANARNLMRIRMALREAAAASASASSPLRGPVSLLWSFISSDSNRLARLNYPADCNIGGATKFARSVPDPVAVMPLAANQLAPLPTTRTVLVKLDAEGGEADFLRTGGRLFTDRTVAAVQMEWLGRHLTDSDAADIVAFFNKRDYSAHLVDGRSRLDQAWTSSWPENVLWVRRDFGWLL